MTWTRLEKADPLFAFTPPEGQEWPEEVYLDNGPCCIWPAYKKGLDGKKGKLAGFYFTSSSATIQQIAYFQSCLPCFSNPYSSALNARFNVLFKEDDKKRHAPNGNKIYYVR